MQIKIPNTMPLIGSPCMSPFKMFEAKNTPIKINRIDKIVIVFGLILVKAHSKMTPIHTNWNIRMMANDMGDTALHHSKIY
jgi:hypothetical protein